MSSIAANLSLVAANKHNTGAWISLMGDIQALSASDAREHYEAFFTVYPTAGKYWMLYAQHELRDENPGKAEAIFKRALPNILDIDLWIAYLDYVEATAPILSSSSNVASSSSSTTEDGEGGEKKEAKPEPGAGSDAIIAAYEFALEHMGFHILASCIWTKYIAYLRTLPGIDAEERGVRTQKMRKAYHRAIASPTVGIELLFEEYSAFERELNTQLATPIIDQHKRAYMAARTSLSALQSVTTGVETGSLPQLPSTSPRAINIVAAFRRWINWEKGNPLNLDEDTLHRRVAFSYNQALLNLYYYPELWFEAHVYFKDLGQVEAASAFLERGTVALPANLLLAFTYAAYSLAQGTETSLAAARDCYESLLQATDSPLAFIHYMRFAWRALSEKAARAIFKRARVSPNVTYHVYVAAALNEFHFTKDLGIAIRIFEAGLDKFGSEPEYVLAYLDHLMHLNDESAVRPVFERALASLPPSAAQQVWSKYLEFEAMRGDVAVVQRLVSRRNAVLTEASEEGDLTIRLPPPEDSLLSQATQYRFMDLYPLTSAETAVIAANDNAKSQKGGPMGPSLSGTGLRPGSRSHAGPSSSTLRSRSGKASAARLAARAKPRPAVTALTRFHPAGADTSRMPVWLQDLALKIPLPTSFSAPLVNLPFLISTLTSLDAVPKAPPNAAVIPGRTGASSVAAASSLGSSAAVKKRKRESVAPGAPALDTATESDVFRARQLKKLKKK